MRRVGSLLVALLALSGCKSEHTRSVHVNQNVQVTMTLRGMFGLHSDWYRDLSVLSGTERLDVELIEDTGWWRGSGLYVHSSGHLVLIEGQAGCIVFRLEPLTRVAAGGFCERWPDEMERAQAAERHDGFPKSRFYRDLYFVGLFFEAPGAGEPLQFNPFSSQQEKLLPDPL